MKFKTTRADDVELNITPLIDVVFLLLIFFMVSTTFERETRISITLPESSAQASEAKEGPIEITIDVQGRYYINGRQLVNTRIDTLMRALQQTLGERTSAPLIISADANTPHQAVITAMDAARQLGLVQIGFTTNQKDNKSK